LIEWQYYPQSDEASTILKEVVVCFERAESQISSGDHTHPSNEVLRLVRAPLQQLGFVVEGGEEERRITVPVLFGRDGKTVKVFHVDAIHQSEKVVVEVEAGRAKTNYQFLKDFFEACMMRDIEYLVIAVRRTYRKSNDFESVIAFMSTLYASGRLKIPLRGILVIGY
jgi:hypothetical protein